MAELMDSLVLNASEISLNDQTMTTSLTNKCINEFTISLNNMTEDCFNNRSTDWFMLSSNHSLLGLETNMTKERPEERPFIPRWWIQIFWSLLFAIMVLVAIVGNLVVIWIVVANRRMRTVTNYFLLNLTIADLSTAVFNAIFNFVFMLNSHWPFGQLYCVVNNFIANLSISVSVFTISATSIDR